MILRPVVYPEIGERMREQAPEISCRGEAGMAFGGAFFADQGRSKRSAEEHERAIRRHGLGAMRGFVLVLCFYLVLGVALLGGLMLWHWLR